MFETVIAALKGVIQMAVTGSAAASIIMQITCLAAMALAVRAFRRLIGK